MSEHEYQLFIGNHERVIGRTVYIKTRSGYSEGTVTGYLFKSNRYIIKMHGGGGCYPDKIYLRVGG